MKKIIAKFKDGSILKGYSNDFNPDRETCHFKLLNGKTMLIDIDKLKALFFVKNFQGDKNRKDKYKDVRPWGGFKIRVVFIDDEVIEGYTPHHSVDEQGFYVMPADMQGNNEQIFVFTTATKEVTFL